MPDLWQAGCTSFKIFMCESGSKVAGLPDGELLAAFRKIGSLMVINGGEKIDKYPIAKWAESFKNRKPQDNQTTFKIPFIEIEGYAATAKVEVSQQGKHIYSDYLSLYKFLQSMLRFEDYLHQFHFGY